MRTTGTTAAKSKRNGKNGTSHGPRMTYEDFVKTSIQSLRDPNGKSRGIHVVFSGFNNAFRKYYGEEPQPRVDQLVKDGVIELRPARKGVMIYLPNEAPLARSGDDALIKILGYA
jgi:hypothetical protein